MCDSEELIWHSWDWTGAYTDVGFYTIFLLIFYTRAAQVIRGVLYVDI